ncbi:MAG TPA: hypothetical protein DCQ98_02220 [Planctomycetaceae bacterium]|nr:hypothetical protein [Planctomycetaceae bacterium]
MGNRLGKVGRGERGLYDGRHRFGRCMADDDRLERPGPAGLRRDGRATNASIDCRKADGWN